ncbi:hypothetical protein MPER_00749, partial [Moniliophthora perniciosa FA553]
DRMTRDLGEKVSYFEGQDEVHDYLLMPWKEPARDETMKEITRWIKSL